MPADFYIIRLSNYRKMAVQKKTFNDPNFLLKFGPGEKRRQFRSSFSPLRPLLKELIGHQLCLDGRLADTVHNLKLVFFLIFR